MGFPEIPLAGRSDIQVCCLGLGSYWIVRLFPILTAVFYLNINKDGVQLALNAHTSPCSHANITNFQVLFRFVVIINILFVLDS